MTYFFYKKKNLQTIYRLPAQISGTTMVTKKLSQWVFFPIKPIILSHFNQKNLSTFFEHP